MNESDGPRVDLAWLRREGTGDRNFGEVVDGPPDGVPDGVPDGRALEDDALAGLYSVDDRSLPWLRVNFVSSVDGAATHEGLSGGLSSAEDKRVFELLRRSSDVVLVGAGTVRAEGYGALRVSEASAAWRSDRGMPPHPVFAIVSGSLGLDPASAIFTEAPTRPIVVTTPRALPGRIAEFSGVADVIVSGDDGIDPLTVRAGLTERGLNQVLCEGGPTLFGSLLAAGAVDELCLTVSPRLEAGDAVRIATATLPRPASLTLAHALVSGDSLLLRYLVR